MQSTLQQRGSLQMAAAMAISGTVGLFVFESGQSPYNVVFFRCLFGALSLAAYCAASGLLQAWRLSHVVSDASFDALAAPMSYITPPCHRNAAVPPVDV